MRGPKSEGSHDLLCIWNPGKGTAWQRLRASLETEEQRLWQGGCGQVRGSVAMPVVRKRKVQGDWCDPDTGQADRDEDIDVDSWRAGASRINKANKPCTGEYSVNRSLHGTMPKTSASPRRPGWHVFPKFRLSWEKERRKKRKESKWTQECEHSWVIEFTLNLHG